MVDKMGKRLLNGLKYWSQLLLLPVYGLLCLMPRDKKLWVFGSTFGRRFADNPKYLYLYLSQYKSQQLRAVWVSKSREIVEFLQDNSLEAYYLYSFSGVWNSLRAGVYFYDNYPKDISYVLSGGALKINLWHGIPLKKIQKDNVFDYFRNPRGFWEWFHAIPRCISDEKPSHYILSTSKSLKPIFASAFRTKHVLVEGYPRNDILLSKTIKNVLTVKEQREYKKLQSARHRNRIALYMPTFRDSETGFFEIINKTRLESFLIKEGYLLCVKLHPKSKQQVLWKDWSCEGVLLLDALSDPYCFLPLADVLITDYSSIYFDFLLAKKPVIFFPYDYKEYISESRELYFCYEDYTPGPKVYNQEELEDALRYMEDIGEKYESIANRVFDTQKPEASERLYNKVAKLLNINQ